MELMTLLITRNIPHTPLLFLDGAGILLFASKHEVYQVVLREELVTDIHCFRYVPAQQNALEESLEIRLREILDRFATGTSSGSRSDIAL